MRAADLLTGLSFDIKNFEIDQIVAEFEGITFPVCKIELLDKSLIFETNTDKAAIITIKELLTVLMINKNLRLYKRVNQNVYTVFGYRVSSISIII